MIKIEIEDIVQQAIPTLQLGCIFAEVVVEKKNEQLWELINETTAGIAKELIIGDISKIETIASSRKGYKALGKDPARYRPSAESLLRRTVQGKGLYQVNNIVDLLNLISIKTGYSIGGYDIDKIEGTIKLGAGNENEPYEGIGKGVLNIQHLPVFRDNKGAFGTPTSDSVRTMATDSTKNFLMLFFNFGNHNSLIETLELAENYLKEFANGANIKKKVIGCG